MEVGVCVPLSNNNLLIVHDHCVCDLCILMQVLKERERAKREAEMEVERVARVKEMEATMERLKRVGLCFVCMCVREADPKMITIKHTPACKHKGVNASFHK